MIIYAETPVTAALGIGTAIGGVIGSTAVCVSLTSAITRETAQLCVLFSAGGGGIIGAVSYQITTF